MSTRFVECYKTLVDCFFDFGQFATSDTRISEKPFSPFAKLLDSCDLSTTQTVTVKNYKPLENDSTTTNLYLVGSGAYDETCFPGNILIPLIDYDHTVALAATAPGPKVMS